MPAVEKAKEIAAAQLAVKVLVELASLRASVARGNNAQTAVTIALSLTADMVDRVLLANEAALLIGAERRAASAPMSRKKRGTEQGLKICTRGAFRYGRRDGSAATLIPL